LAAYWVGNRVPNIDKIVLPLLLLAMVGTFAVVVWKFGGNSEKRRELKLALREEWHYLFNKK
jgi:hypothetical protein